MTDIETAIRVAKAFLDGHRDHLSARDPLRDETTSMVDASEPLVGIWREYAMLTLSRAPRKKGQRRTKYLHRDHCIAEAVYLTVKSGFPPYRSEATRDREGNVSACAVVVEALKRCGIHMTETAVEKIWRRAPGDWNPKNRPSSLSE